MKLWRVAEHGTGVAEVTETVSERKRSAEGNEANKKEGWVEMGLWSYGGDASGFQLG